MSTADQISRPRRERRLIWLTLWTLAGIGLVWALLASLSVTLGDVLRALVSTPLWLFAVVVVLSLANKIVGMMKWRAAARYLATAGDDPGPLRQVELTTLGALFGQVMPVQLATVAVRWVLMGKEARASGLVLRSTFFEQTFDLIVVAVGALVAVAVIMAGLRAETALIALALCLALAVLALRPLLSVAARLLRRIAVSRSSTGFLQAAASGFQRASEAPGRVMLELVAWSLVRLVLVGLRAVAVLWFFAPDALAWLIFVASPGVTLLTALPIAPAGLGVAEWSWSAVLIRGGAAAPEAAIAALNLRLVAIVALLMLVAGLYAVRRVWEARA